METVEDLQRNLMKLEASKRAVMEKMESENRRQRNDIDILTRECMKLKREFNELKAVQSMNTNAMMGSKVSKIQEENVGIDTQCKAEIHRQEELKDKLMTLHEQIARCRERMGTLGGVNAAKETNESVLKQIRVLESRLEKALLKFNETVAVNKDLRHQIDYLRRERAVFDNIYRKLERELQDRKKHIATMIEIANNAYNARDQAQHQMLALKKREEEEHAAFSACMDKLNETLLEGQYISTEMAVLEKEEALARIGQTNRPNTTGGMDDLSSTRPGLNSTRVRSATRRPETAGSIIGANLGRTAASQRSLQGQLGGSVSSAQLRRETLEEAFAKVQAATGISDLDELVKAFASAEDQNFSLFTFANEQAGDVERLQSELSQLRAEVAAAEAADDGKTIEGNFFVADLEAQIERSNEKLNTVQGQIRTVEKTLATLRSGVHAIFSRLGCSLPGDAAAASGRKGGDSLNPAEVDLQLYLKVIEQRTNEMLATHRERLLAADPNADVPIPLGAENAPGFMKRGAGQMQVQLEIAKYNPTGARAALGGELDDSEDELTVEVLSRQELYDRAARDLDRVDARAGSAFLKSR